MARAQMTNHVSGIKNIVINSEHLVRSDGTLVGEKNSSLEGMISVLGAKGIGVPPGFATTTHTYWDCVDANGIGEKIAALVTEWRLDKTNLVETGRAVRSLFLHNTWPADEAAATRTAYREISARVGIENRSVAVRSSAAAEDLPDASFAGQQESHLNIWVKMHSWISVGAAMLRSSPTLATARPKGLVK